MKIRENQQEKIFTAVASIILRARARAKAIEALADQYPDSDFNRKEVEKHEEQAFINY